MYTLITQIRNFFFDKGIFKSSSFDFPIINVGNLSVGGSGKTPHIEFIIRILHNDYNIATLSRGYGRSTKGFREVSISSKASDVGDEPLQIKKRFSDIAVFVGEDRVEAVTKILFSNPEIEVVLLDDAYQHRAIKAGLNILLTDFAKPFTRDMSMPIGRLREKPIAANRSDIVVVTKCPDGDFDKESLKNEIQRYTKSPVLFSKIEYDDLLPFSDKIIDIDNVDNILMLSGIANPKPMSEYLKRAFPNANIEDLSFSDHHKFTKKDIVGIVEIFNSFADQNKILVTTEKDASRLKEYANDKEFKEIVVYILPIRISFLGKDQKVFKEIIEDYVRENKADYGVYKR